MPKRVEFSNDIEPGDVVMERINKSFFVVIAVKEYKPNNWEPQYRGSAKKPILLQCEKVCGRFGDPVKKKAHTYKIRLRTNQVIKMTPDEVTKHVQKEIDKLQSSVPKIAGVLEHQSRLKRAIALK